VPVSCFEATATWAVSSEGRQKSNLERDKKRCRLGWDGDEGKKIKNRKGAISFVQGQGSEDSKHHDSKLLVQGF